METKCYMEQMTGSCIYKFTYRMIKFKPHRTMCLVPKSSAQRQTACLILKHFTVVFLSPVNKNDFSGKVIFVRQKKTQK